MVAQVVTFANPAQVVWEFLTAQLPARGFNVKATGLVPNPRPTEFVRVRLGGGTSVDIITDEPTVFVESFAATYNRAQDLSAMCHSLILAAGREGRFGTGRYTRGVEVISRPQDLPDPVTEQPRYSATYAVKLRGTVAGVPLNL
jgi:hypothetical protein